MKKNKILLSKFKISDITENYISWLRDKSIIKFTKIKNTRIEDIIKYVQKNVRDNSVIFLKILFNNFHIGNIRIKKIKKITKELVTDFKVKTGANKGARCEQAGKLNSEKIFVALGVKDVIIEKLKGKKLEKGEKLNQKNFCA